MHLLFSKIVDNNLPLIVYDGDYFRQLFNILFDKNNFHKFKSYCQYNIIKTYYQFISNNNELYNEFFDFYLSKLEGQEKPKSKEKQALELINDLIGKLVGKLYVESYFSLDDKKDVEHMVNNILNIMKTSIHKNDWLTGETKEKALIKLNKFKVKIGYPDKLPDYNKLEINKNDKLDIIRKKITSFDYKINFLDKINANVDPDDWFMTPQTVNAYFSPQLNEIVFPAAILQPPFYYSKNYSGKYDQFVSKKMINFFKEHNMDIHIPLNYGGIGGVIAHEIIHGYDDQGSKYDGDGNIKNWWTDADYKLFKSKMKLMKEQAKKYEYCHDNKMHKMNAELTMGENIADLGGLTLGIRCIDDNVLSHYLFFRAWANIWKLKTSPEVAINKLLMDPHAPKSFRGNLVNNLDEFYNVFNIQNNDNMYLPSNKRIMMW
jgi:predicted metalloendopeptidase